MIQIKQIFIEITKKIPNAFLQLENRRLLNRINKFYVENEPDETEKLWLKESRKSFRKLIKDRWQS